MDALTRTARARAERAARARLLNAFLRESGRGLTGAGDGTARVELTTTCGAILVDLRHRCPVGQHVYGDDVRLHQPGTPPAPLGHDDLVRILLDEVESLAARAFPGVPGSRDELAGQIAGSVLTTTRHLAHPRVPCADPTRRAEQSLVYGHPFHPTPKSSEGFGADLPRYAPELGASFRLHWFAIDPDAVLERRVAPGDWTPEQLTGAPGPVLPVHPWQADYLRRQPRVARLLGDATLTDLGERGNPVYPTSSVRTVCDPAAASMWKLPLHVRITNFVRNNPVEHLHRAADAGALIAELEPGRRQPGFGVLAETGFRTVDPAVVGEDLAADLAVVFRDNPFRDGRYVPQVMAGLLDGDEPELVSHVRRCGADPREWLARYLAIWLLPLLDVFDRDGVSFEAHVQNSLLHTENGWPARVWVRDLEGTSVSRKRVRVPVPEDSPLLYDDEEAWMRLQYHAITNHLGHLVHVLARYTGTPERSLCEAAREVLAGAGGESAARLLETPTLPAKANLLSRFTGRGERPWYVEVPNPLHRAGRVRT